MDTALGDAAANGIIKSLTDTANGNGLAKSLKELNGKLTGQNTDVTIQKADYEAVQTAVDTIKESIDKTLEAGGLTQLDTSNLKAIKTAVVDLKNTFESIEGIKQNGADYKVAVADIAKVKEAVAKVTETTKEAGASATKALSSSKAQAENIGEMRTQLQAFAANPKGAELESANFTGYLETVDAALSNISDQRAKLGASQNETATSSKAKVDDLLKTGGTLTAKITELTKQLDPKTTDSLAAKIADASKTVPNTAVVNFKDAYDKFEAAVTESTKLIDEALKSNDLTELDTTNLKALRSYITETKATFDAALKDSGLKADVDNTAGTVTQEAIAKLQAGLDSATELGRTATSSKAAMEGALGDATKGIIKSLTDITNGTGLAKSLAEVVKKIDEGIAGGPKAAEITAAVYTAVQTSVTDITTIINDVLEAGGLTELDTSNLKTLKTAVENVGKTFKSIGEIKPNADKYKVEVKDIAKAKEAMTSLGKDLTEASTFAQNSSNASQNQAQRRR